ncbi:hypothetical protein R3I94_016800 [Phoxinus phoxinus]
MSESTRARHTSTRRAAAMAHRLSMMYVNALHQYCCPAPCRSKPLAVPAPLSECRNHNVLHQFCCPPSGSNSPSR